jgi:hypothetical protein
VDDILSDPSIEMHLNDLFIPARTLSVGSYKVTLRVSRTDDPRVGSSSSMFLNVVPVSVEVKFVSDDRWKMIHASEKDLLLDPGRYSLSSDKKIFNRTVSSSLLSLVLFDLWLMMIRNGPTNTLVEFFILSILLVQHFVRSSMFIKIVFPILLGSLWMYFNLR